MLPDDDRELAQILEELTEQYGEVGATGPVRPSRRQTAIEPRPSVRNTATVVLRPDEPKRKFWRRNELLLLAGVVFLLVPGIWWVASNPTPPDDAAEEADARPPLPAQTVALIQAGSRVHESKFPRPDSATWTPDPQVNFAERERTLRGLEIDGCQPCFIPPYVLEWPADNQPVTGYCLLRMPLDEVTERKWAEKGLLKREYERMGCFLRFVSAEDKEALDLLKSTTNVDGLARRLNQP